MKESGLALAIVGVIVLIFGALIDVSVSTSSISGDPYVPSIPSQSIANLYKMHLQSLVVHGGFFAILTGAVLAGCGAVAERLAPPSGPGGEAAPDTIYTATAVEDAPVEGSSYSSNEAETAPVAEGATGLSSGEWALVAGMAIFLMLAIAAVAFLSEGSRTRLEEPVNLDATNQALSDAENTLRELNELDPRRQ
jgi:hypothetical protein